jgi:hypothetical protein
MGTFVVQSPDHSVDVGNTQCSWAGTEFPGLSREREFAFSTDFHQCTHRYQYLQPLACQVR